MDLQQLSIHPFATASKDKSYLLEINGRFFEIGKDAAELLEYLQKNGMGEDCIERYVEIHAGKPSQKEILAFLNTFEKKFESEGDTGKKIHKAFLYNKDFLSAQTVEQYSTVLKHLFRPWLMIMAVTLFAGLEMLYFFYARKNVEHTIQVNVYMIAGLYIFMALSSLVHEFGHAAACKYFGMAHGNIGFGLYLNLPVFYTDVTHVWKLSRHQRCVVNFGGVYFQILMLIPLLITAIVEGNELLDYMILLLNFNFTLTMNPFFKFDGYWMMTDLLGIPNLRKKGNEWLMYTFNKLLGKNASAPSNILSLALWAKCGLLVYIIVVNMFFCFYFFYVIPLFFTHFIQTFPDRIYQLMTELSFQQMPSWGNLQQIVLQLFFFFLFLYMTWRIVVPLIKRLAWLK